MRREREAQTLKAVIESMSDGLVFIDKAGGFANITGVSWPNSIRRRKRSGTGVTIDTFLDTIARYGTGIPISAPLSARP